MKKLMYFAAALLVLTGCNKKDNALTNAPEGTPFKKGQQVTLSVGTGDNANQAAPRKVAGIDNTTNNRIDFTWEEGDKILVKVGDATAEFTLSSEPGLAEGEFTGEMPADGSTFDIQYPTTTPDLSAQVYTTDKTIPADKMLFTATGCTLGVNATLQAQYAMLQLNLYGADKTIGKIVVTDISNIFDASKPVRSYTLTCGGKEIGADAANATPFYIVVPAGEYRFEVRIWNNAVTPAKLAWFGTSAAKTFTAGNCLNMPKREVKVERTYVDLGEFGKWATVNIEDVAPEDHGKTYTYDEGPNPTIVDERWPEKADFEKLVSFSNKKWVADFLDFGANGYLFINGNEYLFFPAAFGHDGSFWASDADWSSAWTLYISNEPAIYTRTRGLYDGYLIRTMWEHYEN